MISSRNLYNVKFNGIELESKLLKATSDREIATSLNFINLGIDLHPQSYSIDPQRVFIFSSWSF